MVTTTEGKAAMADPGKERRTGHRRHGREMALQMLFQWDLARSPLPQILREFDLHLYATETGEGGGDANPKGANPEPASPGAASHVRDDSSDRVQPDPALVFARRLVEGVVERTPEIDRLIAEHAENWRIERMSTVDRNVLRLAVYELSTETDVPKVVVIDEAIEIAKRFGSEQSGAFVNGLLDALLHRESFPGILK